MRVSFMMRSGLFLAAALYASAGQAEPGAVCKYQQITALHERMVHCSEPLEPEVEQRYAILRAILKQHMQAGGIDTAEKFGPDFDQAVRKAQEAKPGKEICKAGPEYSELKRTFYRLTSPLSVKEATRMKASVKQDSGDCP
ncbi:MAG: hypothetical protein P8Y36_11295 [Alphaproteobacteria bacterium]